LRNQFKKKPLLAACDIYRPAAVKQLETIGKSLGIPVFHEEQSTPVTIAKHAQIYAGENEHDIVIYDTAGRLQIDEDMMAELDSMVALLSPREKFLVADAMTGQDAVNVAKEFNSRLNISGVVLSKLDGDTRGGAALSIKSVTGKPIIYMGIGEKPDALEVLHPNRLASRILGMGDVVSLVEKAQDTFDQKEARKMEKKILQNKFDLNDFLVQIQQIKKMGSISDLVGMIPGLSKLKGMKVDEKQFVHIEAILNSATNHERTTPKILDGSRRRRIAAGSGTSIQQVNQVLKQFEQMRKMIKQIMGGGKKGKQMRRMMKQMGSDGFPGM
jgi:signal recognition particle subunit SRP54